MKNFIKTIEQSIENEEFVKLTISKSKNHENDVKNIYFKLVVLKKGLTLCATYRKATQDFTKNYEINEGLQIIEQLLQRDFSQAILFTINHDIQIQINSDADGNQKVKTKKSPATFSQAPDKQHNKVKTSLINIDKNYLYELEITNKNGNIRADKQSKYRQINRFIELLVPYLKQVEKNNKYQSDSNSLNIVDMGCGKGYLTFALYDYIANIMKLDVRTFGVEMRDNLVDICNEIAKKNNFNNLEFIKSTIESYNPEKIDVLIALHACNTATDDALYKGINSDAKLIVVAPCCHKQIRQNMSANDCANSINSINQFGIFKERQAELLTDTLRALLLKTKGYKTSVVEFINSEHTAKNIMIIAEKRKNIIDTTKTLKDIIELKQLFGIKEHYLENLINSTN